MNDSEQQAAHPPQSHPPLSDPSLSRRALIGLSAGIGLLGGAGIGFGTAQLVTRPGSPNAVDAADASEFDPTGFTQPGVARPSTPQRHAFLAVANVDVHALPTVLPQVGQAILDLHERPDPVLLPEGPASLTVTVGLGQRALEAFPAGSPLQGFLDMPTFRGDELLPEDALGGDLFLSVNAEDPVVLAPVLEHLSALFPGFRLLWSEQGFRGPGEYGVARNPFGYHDGVIVPRGDDELNRDVWIQSGPLAGGTVCVIRRFELLSDRFAELTRAEQDGIIGRERVTGAPLSGGELHDEANLALKHPDGELVIPVDAHVRAAHPSFVGAGLMLRRSYSFQVPAGVIAGDKRVSVSSAGGHGLLFTAFQNETRTFSLTQQRMDEVDALMEFVRPTATAAFVILPGFDADRPLGSSLL